MTGKRRQQFTGSQRDRNTFKKADYAIGNPVETKKVSENAISKEQGRPIPSSKHSHKCYAKNHGDSPRDSMTNRRILATQIRRVGGILETPRC